MKKLVDSGLFKALASVFVFIAAKEVNTASFWLYYQPKAPKSLVK